MLLATALVASVWVTGARMALTAAARRLIELAKRVASVLTGREITCSPGALARR
jgi:hypothetical protein